MSSASARRVFSSRVRSVLMSSKAFLGKANRVGTMSPPSDQRIAFRRFVHQTLPFRPFEGSDHSLAVRCLPKFPAEAEPIAVPMQVLPAQLVKNTVVAALEQRKKGF